MVITVKCGIDIMQREYTASVRLDKALTDAGLLISHLCSGRGKCGKCKVKASGCLSEITAEEARLLSESELKNGIRLSCCAVAVGDALLEYTEAVPVGLTDGESCRSSLTEKKGSGFGAVFDIGTTTLACSLVSLETGKRVYSTLELNEQAPFGADVISRMAHANNGGLAEEKSAITTQIERITAALPVKPVQRVITGNTAMLHLYKGLPVDRLSVYPFTAESLFGEWNGDTYLAPCIGAFVGADITAAVLASGMTEKTEKSVLVDLGTNGEMAYYSSGKLLCCATAMGPAFEGAGISSGMVAQNGAISHVYLASSRVEYSVIGTGKAVGITGSGLIDAIACMLELDEIDETGYLDSPFFIGDSGISITPADVRAVQLAKAAVRSGLEVLCEGFSDIGTFYVAGGFGSSLNLRSCVKIGLFPPELAQKAVILGNASLIGGELLLTRENAILKAHEIADCASDINLAAQPGFSEKYIDNMYFMG